MSDDPNDPALDQPAGIPPIDPSINGTWTPPWLSQQSGPPPVVDTGAPPLTPAEKSEIQIDKPLAEKTPEQQLDPTLSAAIPTDQQFTPPWLAVAQAGVGAPQVDAVSGAPGPSSALNPQQAQDRFATIATDPTAPLDERSKAWASMTPDQRTNALNTTDPKQLAAIANDAMTPQELATISVRHNAAKLDEETMRLHAIYAENAAKARQEADAQAKASAYADAEAAKDAAAAEALVAQAKNNPNQRSASRTIADVVLAGIGGMVSQFTGGKNLALESIQKRVEQNIQQQTQELNLGWKAIDLHKNAVASEYARHGDVIRAQAVARIAGLQEAKDALTTDMQNYDPNGTTALSRAQVIQQIDGVQRTAANTLHQQNFKNGMELAKAQTEAAAQTETMRKNKADESLAWTKEGREGAAAKAVKPDDVVHDPAWFAQQGYKTVPAVAMSVKSFGGITESNAKAGEAAGKDISNKAAAAKGQVAAPIQVGTAPDGTPVTKTTVLTQPDGTAWAAPDKFTEMAAGAKKVARISDALVREINEWGGQSDIKKSPHYQQITSLHKDLIFALHEAKKIEGFRPGTGEQLEELTGGVDPTSFFRDATPGIKAVKQNITDDLNDEATTALYKGPRIVFNDLSAPPAQVDTPADKQDKVLTQNFGASDMDESALDADNRAFTIAARKGVTTAPSANRADYAEAQGLSPLATRALDNGVAPIQLQAFDDLEGDIKGSDDVARAKAVERLEQVRKGSKSSAVRAYAKGLIEEASSTVLENTPLDVEGKR